MFKKTSILLFIFSISGLFGTSSIRAATNTAPVSAEDVEKARALIHEAGKIGDQARQNEALKISFNSAPQADSKNIGFQKFLAIKDVCAEDVSKSGEQARTALLENFKLWDRSESPIVKVAASSCLGPGDFCSSSIWCCGALSCRGGVCSGANGGCIPRGRACSSSLWCCGTGVCGDHGYCQ